jgi:hypothetical protein
MDKDVEYLPEQPVWRPMEEWLNDPPKRHRRNVAGQWPIVSEAAAIDPEDIPKQQAILAEHGVKTEYTPTGEPIFRDRKHRKEHCEAVGLYDRNGGYSDPQPRNR